MTCPARGGVSSCMSWLWVVGISMVSGCVTPANHVHLIDNNVPQIPSAGELDWARTGGRIALSPDGQEIATLSLRRSPSQGYPPGAWQPPTIWNLETKAATVHLPASALAAAWSHDGTWLATVGRLGEDQALSIHLWDSSTAEHIRSIEIGELRIAPAVAISPDDSLVLWISREGSEGKLTVHSLKSGESVMTSDARILPPRGPADASVIISADNSRIYYHNAFWKLETKPSLKLSERREFRSPRIMAVSPDFKHGYSVDYRYAVDARPMLNKISVLARGSLWSENDRDHSRKVALYQIDLSNGAITQRWDFTYPEQYSQQRTGPQIVMATNAIAVSPDGSRLALGTRNGIHVIDLRANKDVAWLAYDRERKDALPPWANISEVAFFPDGKRIIGAAGPQVFFWDLP